MLTMRRTVADGVRMCTGRARAEQDAAHRDAVAGGDAQQVVRDVGGIDVRHHEHVGFGR